VFEDLPAAFRLWLDGESRFRRIQALSHAWLQGAMASLDESAVAANDCPYEGVDWHWAWLTGFTHGRLFKEMQKELKALASYKEDQEDFMAMMTADLAKFKCMHSDGDERGHDSTPPYMWPELIACIVKRAVEDDRKRRA
jgi:hypothetical protein